MKSYLLFAVLLFAIAGVCNAAVININPDGTGDYPTIQAAIISADNGDHIVLADGTYRGDGNRDVEFLGKPITVRSANGAENCIIDCQSSYEEFHRGFIFTDGEDADSVLKGVSITNGNVGISGNFPSDDEIKYGGYGGGIFCQYSGPTIDGCVIKNCSAIVGSAIASRNDGYWEWPEVEAKSPVIKSCIITGNISYISTLSFDNTSGTVIENCSITENVMRDDYYGYVIVFDNSRYSDEMDDIVIRNSIIYDNLLTDGQNIYQIGLSYQRLPLLVIENCNIEGGIDGIYNPYGRDIEWGEGNIDVDPEFVRAGHWVGDDVWVEGDYHLGINSPCINAGSMSGYQLGQTDIDGEERMMGGRVDIGADELVMYDVPYLLVSPGHFIFNIYENEPESAYHELEIHNAGVGGFNWEIVEDCPWLNVDKVSGWVPEVSFETVRLSVLGSGLSVGSYTYQLVVSTAEAQNEQQVVEIVLNVKDPLSVPGEYGTIQAAVNAAHDGDIVLLADGVYTGVGNMNINYGGKAITVKSENGPESCIIDCSEGGVQLPGGFEAKGFTFKNGEGAKSVLDGVTITNGNAGGGGGIYISGTSPTIRNCILLNNFARNNGGGIYCRQSPHMTIKDCKFINNTTDENGGGIYATVESNISIEGCSFVGNTASNADGRGGAIFVSAYDVVSNIVIEGCDLIGNRAGLIGGAMRFQDDVNATVLNSKIVNNSSEYDGGVSANNCVQVTMTNCLVSGNSSKLGVGGLKINSGNTVITNCTIVNNSGGEGQAGALGGRYHGIINTLFAGNSIPLFDAWDSTFSYCYFDEDQGYQPGERSDNQSGDPKLTGSFHLQADSPCIDAGDNSAVTQDTDLDGNGRILNGVVDIGAYEYTGVSRLIISPILFDFSAYHGQPDPISADVILKSDYPIDDINWFVVEKDSLIEVSKMGGTVSAGGFDKVSVSIDVSGLGVGYYVSSLVIVPESDPEDRQMVNIYFRIVDPVMVPDEYNTIQDAVDAASYGDIVLLADGVYTGVGNMNINYGGKAITVKSENGPESCIIDCSEGGVQLPGGFEAKGFTFKNGEGAKSVLDGVTITNGNAGGGGGIYISGTSPTIRNCILLNNFARNNGGGIYCRQSSHMTIKDCKFINNATVERGGAIFVEGSSDVIIEGCDLIGNSAGFIGGGMRFQDDVNATVLNSKIVNNSSEYDGGVSANNCVQVTMTNCLVSGNSSKLGVGGLKINSGNTVITNCTIVNNSGGEGQAGALFGSYKGVINTLFAGNSKPLFNMFNMWDSTFSYCYFDEDQEGDPIVAELIGTDNNQMGDPMLNEDYRLHAGSPCIDAGNNDVVTDATDLDGNARIMDGDGDGGAIVDMGAYEVFPSIQVNVKFTPQTLNCSSEGNWVMAHFVLPEGYTTEDVDTDRQVTIYSPGVASDHINVLYNTVGLVEVEAVFVRSELCGLGLYGDFEFTARGWFADGMGFFGADTIRITTNRFEKLADFLSYWLDTDCSEPGWCGGYDIDGDGAVDLKDFVLLE